MVFDKKLLDIIACPTCKSKLVYQANLNELWCKAEKLAYPIRNGIPVLLDPEARTLTIDEINE